MVHPFPSFASPPVTEVVIASRFQPVDASSLLTTADLARSAASTGHDVIEERPGYDAPAERFGPASPGTQLSLEVLAGPPPTRYWFRNDVGDELLQLQPNWLAANWRKVAPTAEYGRWDSRWSAFARWAEAVESTLRGDVQPLVHDQVEVTYVNHIETRGVWSTHADASDVFSFLADADRRGYEFLGDPEQSTSDMQFLIPHPAEGRPIGRLHVSVRPVFKRPTHERVFLMNLTARGAPLAPDLQGVKGFADLGHEWIVRAFADLTTQAMHTAWGRNDDKGVTDD